MASSGASGMGEDEMHAEMHEEMHEMHETTMSVLCVVCCAFRTNVVADFYYTHSPLRHALFIMPFCRPRGRFAVLVAKFRHKSF